VKRLDSVLLLTDPEDHRVLVESVRLASWLRERDVSVSQIATSGSAPTCPHADLGIVLGGDGTFLRAARCLPARLMPLIGMRFGSFGFLAELDPSNWEEDLARLLAGEGKLESWMRLRCSLASAATPDRFEDLGLVLNDVVLTAQSVASMVELGLRIDGEDITQYRGDGLIIATAVGSTAYSLAAGGPILESTDRNILLTPNGSHALTYRPLVLQHERVIEVVVADSRRGTSLTIDGDRTEALQPGDVVRVEDSGQDLQVATVVRRSRFRTLRERLHWGAPLFERD
jgi:NAD+ kinase